MAFICLHSKGEGSLFIDTINRIRSVIFCYIFRDSFYLEYAFKKDLAHVIYLSVYCDYDYR
jgi:hypothetical protein